MPETYEITQSQLEAAIEKGTERGVQKAFTRIGIDVSTPDAIIKRQDEFSYLRQKHADSRDARRQAQKLIIDKGFYVFFTVITLGVYHFIKHGGP